MTNNSNSVWYWASGIAIAGILLPYIAAMIALIGIRMEGKAYDLFSPSYDLYNTRVLIAYGIGVAMCGPWIVLTLAKCLADHAKHWEVGCLVMFSVPFVLIGQFIIVIVVMFLTGIAKLDTL